jgi:hypothetical protein
VTKERADYLKDFGKALSLSNLLYIRLWLELTAYTREDAHYMKLPPAPVEYFALMANVVLLAAVLWAGITWARRSDTKFSYYLVRGVFLLILVILANAIRDVCSRWMPLLRGDLFRSIGSTGVLIIVCSVAVAAGLAALRWPQKLIGGAVALLVICEPAILVTFFRAGEHVVHYSTRGFADKPPAEFLPLSARSTNSRVVWVIFDELDQRLSFVDRPPTVKMPEFDRLRAESLYASNAYSPAGATRLSVPSLLLGQRVREYTPAGPDDTRLTIRGVDHPVLLSTAETVFSRARQLGFNTAMAGWYMPYCRMLSDLNSCWWSSFAMQYNSMGNTFGELLMNQPRSLFETNLLSVFGQSLSTQARVTNYLELLAQARRFATDGRIGLTFIHFQPPHGPHSYNRFTKEFELGNSPIGGYLDSLALADRSLGDLRRSLEEAGLWDQTTILVSSDHWYRTALELDGKFDRRVPFLLKFADQKEGVVYDPVFNTLGSSELLLSVLRGDIKDIGGVSRWLDGHKNYTTNPYIFLEK